MKACSIVGCNEKHRAYGLCELHHRQHPKVKEGKNVSVKKWRVKNPEKNHASYKRNARTVKGKFRKLKSDAKKKALPLTIPLYVYEHLCRLPCRYCGGPLPEAGHGLDRQDNTRGYVPGNVYPCCQYCNQMKSNLLTPQRMQIAMNAIARAEGISTHEIWKKKS